MNKLTLREIPPGESFEVMHHTFSSIREVRDAVSICCNCPTSWHGKRISNIQPTNPVAGIYVAMISEPYPCFDSSDYIYEKREYCNFFFSDSPITAADLARLAEMHRGSGYCYVSEDMDPAAAPALYWRGDITDNLLLATLTPTAN